jgi:hypothetical protein
MPPKPKSGRTINDAQAMRLAKYLLWTNHTLNLGLAGTYTSEDFAAIEAANHRLTLKGPDQVPTLTQYDADQLGKMLARSSGRVDLSRFSQADIDLIEIANHEESARMANNVVSISSKKKGASSAPLKTKKIGKTGHTTVLPTTNIVGRVPAKKSADFPWTLVLLGAAAFLVLRKKK